MERKKQSITVAIAEDTVSNESEHSMYKQASYVFWKVMEIDNAIFQDLESFGKWNFSI